MIKQAENQVVKKRGRPPKNTEIPIFENYENIEEDIILYFPKKNLNNYEKNKKIDDNEEERKNNIECIKIKNKNNIKIKNNNKIENNIEKENNIKENNNKNKQNEEYKNIFDKKIIIYNINCPFEINPDNTIILQKTNLGCLWDTFEINDIPYFLPDYIKDGKFYVIGWFCSLNCAVAYNIKLNDERIFERISLLKYMYNIDGEENISPSPNILVLKKFGGILNIDEYRNKLNNIKSSRLVYKPMICNLPTFEETLY